MVALEFKTIYSQSNLEFLSTFLLLCINLILFKILSSLRVIVPMQLTASSGKMSWDGICCVCLPVNNIDSGVPFYRTSQRDSLKNGNSLVWILINIWLHCAEQLKLYFCYMYQHWKVRWFPRYVCMFLYLSLSQLQKPLTSTDATLDLSSCNQLET